MTSAYPMTVSMTSTPKTGGANASASTLPGDLLGLVLILIALAITKSTLTRVRAVAFYFLNGSSPVPDAVTATGAHRRLKHGT